MSEAEDAGLEPDELEAEHVEPLPEREAMSLVDLGLDPGPVPIEREPFEYEQPVEPRT